MRKVVPIGSLPTLVVAKLKAAFWRRSPAPDQNPPSAGEPAAADRPKGASTPVAAASSGEETVFDPSAILDVFDCFDEDAAAILDKFSTGSRDSVVKIVAQLDRGDVASARATAHRAAGGAKSVGALQFGYLCSRIEHLLQENQLEEARRLSATLTTALESANHVIATYCDGMTSSP